MRALMKWDAVAEMATGMFALVVPQVLARLLTGTELAPAGIVGVRCFGLAIVGLGIACWPDRLPSDRSRSAWRGLLAYNALIAVYLLAAGVAGDAKGVLLWPVVGIHAVVALLLAWMGRAAV